jgi:hypothetical protein
MCTMPSSLFHELLSMCEDQCLICCFRSRLDTIDKLSEDNLDELAWRAHRFARLFLQFYQLLLPATHQDAYVLCLDEPAPTVCILLGTPEGGFSRVDQSLSGWRTSWHIGERAETWSKDSIFGGSLPILSRLEALLYRCQPC